MNKYRTLLVRVMQFRLGYGRISVGIPTFLVIFAFLPHYRFRYGGIRNALDRILFEVQQEHDRVLAARRRANMKTSGGSEASDLRKVAELKIDEPMNTWPAHNDYHRKNTHPFSGSLYGNLYWDEECLRCQLEKLATERATISKPQVPFKDRHIAES